ncbi:MAG: hypothetical protein ACQETL_03285 [Bacteroidota bacterium]
MNISDQFKKQRAEIFESVLMSDIELASFFESLQEPEMLTSIHL